MSTFTRRALLAGAGATVSSAALGAVAVPALTRDPEPANALERAEFYATKLAEVMAEPGFLWGRFEVTIHSGDADQDVFFRNIGSPQLRRDYRLRQFMAAASDCDPGIVAWHHAYMPDHWSGLSFQLNAISDKAYERAAEGAHPMYGDDKAGTVFPVSDFKRIA